MQLPCNIFMEREPINIRLYYPMKFIISIYCDKIAFNQNNASYHNVLKYFEDNNDDRNIIGLA